MSTDVLTPRLAGPFPRCSIGEVTTEMCTGFSPGPDCVVGTQQLRRSWHMARHWYPQHEDTFRALQQHARGMLSNFDMNKSGKRYAA